MSKLYGHEFDNHSNYAIKVSNSPCSTNLKENEKMPEPCQDNDRGDSKVHSENSTKPVSYQHPEFLAAGECQMPVNPNSAYPYNQEPRTSYAKASVSLKIVHFIFKKAYKYQL
jgi:hypothetical protein